MHDARPMRRGLIFLRTRRLLLFAAAAAAGIPLVLAAPALASARRPAWPVAPPAKGAPALRGSATPSPLLAGYQYDIEDLATSGSTDFVVPTVKNCASTNTAIRPGVYIETAMSYSAAGMFVGCKGGKARYFVSLVVNGTVHNFPSLAAKPGDKVAVSLAEGGATRASVVDKTRKGVKKTLSGTGPFDVGGPVIGDTPVFPPSSTTTPEGVPDFGKLYFSNAQFDGLPIGSYDGHASQLDRYNGPTQQIATSSIGGNKMSFHTTFKHS